jgi:ParB/RepB/Spo0J family partition protein
MSTLTNKREASISGSFKWPTVGESGRVPIDSIMENPRNPRKHFDSDETNAMADSIREGGQREIGTVRLITPDDKAPPGVRYMLTSGARRYRGARLAGATQYDIRVKAYESLGQEMLDALMLNEDRKPVSDIELAWYYRELMEENGWNQTELATAINRTLVWVSDRVMCLRCTEKVQFRMHPRFKYKAFNLQVGIAFSKLQPELQDELVDAMPRELETAASQLHWLETQINVRGVEIGRRKRKPKTFRGILEAFAVAAQQKADMMSAPEFSRLFENTSDAEADTIARKLREALRDFEKLVVRVEELAASEKKSTMLVPREHMPWGKPKEPTPSVVPIRPAMDPSDVARRLAEMRASSKPECEPVRKTGQITKLHPHIATGIRQSGPPPSKPRAEQVGERYVSYFNENCGRYVGKSVTPKEHDELEAKGLLKSQREKG